MKKLLFAMILISCANQTPKENFIVEVTYYNGDKDTTSVQCEPEMDCLYINKGDLFLSQNPSALMSGVRRFRVIEVKKIRIKTMKIKNRIYKSELVEWEKVNDIQPEQLKEHYNINHLRKSILKYGVSKAYDICEIDGELYWLDGHTRTEMFRTLQSEGIEIPKMLMANFCEVKNRQEAISILLEVHNIKHDPINTEVLTEWVNIEQVEVEVTSLNVVDINLPNYTLGHEANSMNDEDIDITEDFDPIGNASELQRVVFIFDGSEEAESYLKSLNVQYKKMNMAWQVNLSTQSIL